MELFTALLGLAMFYAWIHSIVIVATKTENTSTYEKTILLIGVSAFVLYIIGTM